MPRQAKPLNDRAVKTATATNGMLRKLFDGNGLQLWIMPDGRKYWRADYRLNGIRKLFAIGVYPTVSLATARKEAAAARELAGKGIDPVANRRSARAAAVAQTENTFEALAKKVFREQKTVGQTDATLTKKGWVLRKFSSSFRHTPVAQMTTNDLRLQLVAKNGVGTGEIGFRMQSLISEVFRHAAQHGIITYNPAHDLKGIVRKAAVVHRAAITKPKPFAALLRKIEEYAERNCLTGVALKLMALLYQRPGELRKAKWPEFELDAAIWHIPKERMKMRRPHDVYLPRQAVALLRKLYEVTGPSGFLFPSNGRKALPMSENTMNKALRTMGIPQEDHTAHGFRSSASTLLNESGLFRGDMIELSLAHRDPDKVRSTYNRGEFIAERIRMAQWWADHLDGMRRSA